MICQILSWKKENNNTCRLLKCLPSRLSIILMTADDFLLVGPKQVLKSHITAIIYDSIFLTEIL